MTRAIAYRTFGGPEVLELIDVAEPTAKPGKLVVAVEAAGVNPIDAKLRGGLRASDPITTPRRVGNDGAGRVVEVGEGVDGFRPGDAVAFFGAVGAYTERLAINAAKVHQRPAGVSAAQGAAVGIPAGTAFQSLLSLGVRSGDTLLLHGGSGAVGQFAIQFAVLLGARVLATTSDARADRVRELGAEPIAYGDGLAERVRDIAQPTVILDLVGTDEALESSLALLDDRHRIATIVQGAKAQGLGIRAFSGGSPEPLTAQQEAWRAEAVPVALALLGSGAFSVEIGEQLPLAEATRAHEILAAGAKGKIVLVP
ncbi:MAG: NADP-dependent oxidoreductase [Microbacterium sp.]